jgi:protein TonB
MANMNLIAPEDEGLSHPAPILHPADGPLWHEPVKEEGVFSSLISSVRDVFFPVKLPPLVLESKPIAVVDRMAVKRDPKSTAVAVVLHVVVIGLIVFFVGRQVKNYIAPKQELVTALEAPPPIKIPPKANIMGGGGGQKSPTPVAQGRLPKFDTQQITPPKAPPLEQPKISVEPTVVMQKDLKMANSTLPNLGMPNSPIVGTGSLGNGNGTGIGSGNGAGVGAGSGGNTGGGAMRIGGGVSAPIPISMPDPEFSEEARKAKVAGNVLVYLWVDQNGNPTHVRVIRGIGMGLDEKAMEAVRQYKFKPARKDGKPVTVEMNVEVNFQIF